MTTANARTKPALTPTSLSLSISLSFSRPSARMPSSKPCYSRIDRDRSKFKLSKSLAGFSTVHSNSAVTGRSVTGKHPQTQELRHRRDRFYQNSKKLFLEPFDAKKRRCHTQRPY